MKPANKNDAEPQDKREIEHVFEELGLADEKERERLRRLEGLHAPTDAELESYIIRLSNTSALGDTIYFTPITQAKRPFHITYWIEANGIIVKEKRNTTSLATKQFTPKTAPITIYAELVKEDCEIQHTSINVTIPAHRSSINLTRLSFKKGNITLTLAVFRGKTKKSVVRAWVKDAIGKKMTTVTTATVTTQFTNISLTLFLKPCNNSVPPFSVVITGLDQNIEITLNKTICERVETAKVSKVTRAKDRSRLIPWLLVVFGLMLALFILWKT